MFILYTFLGLLLIQGLIILVQWNKIKEFQALISNVASVTTIDRTKHYNAVVKVVGNLLNNFKTMLLIPLILLLVLDLILSLILGGILEIIF